MKEYNKYQKCDPHLLSKVVLGRTFDRSQLLRYPLQLQTCGQMLGTRTAYCSYTEQICQKI